MSDWHKRHGQVINDFLHFLNSRSHDYVLKGGTSLMQCYHLDRFSEDIDLDSTNKQLIPKIVDDFCAKHGYQYRVAKNTDTVKRYMIHYDENSYKPLKIEVSYRLREIPMDRVVNINGITVYNLNTIAYMKLNAYNARDKIRDLYDVTFLCKHHCDELSPQILDAMRDSLQYKGMDYFDSIVAEQFDELIDTDKLANDFLDVLDTLGLMYDGQEQCEEVIER